jgi:succinate dehydrogenase/fumarate reductase cytochrome b subunit
MPKNGANPCWKYFFRNEIFYKPHMLQKSAGIFTFLFAATAIIQPVIVG